MIAANAYNKALSMDSRVDSGENRNSSPRALTRCPYMDRNVLSVETGITRVGVGIMGGARRPVSRTGTWPRWTTRRGRAGPFISFMEGPGLILPGGTRCPDPGPSAAGLPATMNPGSQPKSTGEAPGGRARTGSCKRGSRRTRGADLRRRESEVRLLARSRPGPGRRGPTCWPPSHEPGRAHRLPA